MDSHIGSDFDDFLREEGMLAGVKAAAWKRVRIASDPKILVGKPVIRGTRLAVDFILDLLSQGWSNDEILRNYPGIEVADIQACLTYAATPGVQTPG